MAAARSSCVIAMACSSAHTSYRPLPPPLSTLQLQVRQRDGHRGVRTPRRLRTRQAPRDAPGHGRAHRAAARTRHLRPRVCVPGPTRPAHRRAARLAPHCGRGRGRVLPRLRCLRCCGECGSSRGPPPWMRRCTRRACNVSAAASLFVLRYRSHLPRSQHLPPRPRSC
jgi:hypothetical protein